MKKESICIAKCVYIVLILSCASFLSGCTEGALYATQMAIGGLQYAGAAASIASNISESEKKKAEEKYKKAVSYFNNKQYAMAEENINEAIKIGSSSFCVDLIFLDQIHTKTENTTC